MPAGTNCRIKAIRLDYSYDDDVGGATPSGTVLHESLAARIDEEMADVGFLRQNESTYRGQGIETKASFSGIIWGHNLGIREQDEIVIVSPPNHHYFGKYFRIEGVKYDNRHPGIKQGYLLVKMTRSQIAHSEPFQ